LDVSCSLLNGRAGGGIDLSFFIFRLL